ncbi:peroxidase [Mangrovactinospora gilvigrisea]|uniref:Deferrochelatase n=1 Tax=Mangrovactinospora gilvigrisea TaxID=1428644 RepID=A0A1J7BIH5_9ACTN|nr:iron uptake transporter deferrochelatase/peroxidase subunit [Mangrovactinospora gilvigrisea]OIV38463.1 peroxidase [Mangrovactinospora gilvigrisea]
MSEPESPGPVTRRRLLGTAAATAAAGLAAGAGGAAAAQALTAAPAPTPLTAVGTDRVPFHGAHQAGIAQRAQAVGQLAAFDLRPAGRSRRALAALLRRWTAAAAAMAEGRPPSDDDQVALDAGPSRLTVTFGLGRSLFARVDGLGDRLPAALAPIPAFGQDQLDPARSDGDLFVQIGADDPNVAWHALRTVQRLARGTAAVRWQMSGFNRAPGAATVDRTPRNLMGQVDGTGNPASLGKVWVPRSSGDQAWMRGGSYAVVRRIRMLLDDWDELDGGRQEAVIGRRRSTGAPLSAPAHAPERTPMDLAATGSDGLPAIAANAHIRLAAPQSNGGATLLRRTFSFHDGYDPDGAPDAGLLFVAWQADPRTGFVPVQRRLDRGDALSVFVRHVSSALFAVPPGCAPGEYVGQPLLEA